jgi:large subunit ribosomal protein L13
MIIIDAKELILGRLATFAAKRALQGEEVQIMHCEDAVITGTKENIVANYQRKRSLGTFKGPFYSRMSDRFVKRTIRGMLPYKTPHGREAYKRIRCHIGVPEELLGREKEAIQVPSAHVSKLPSFKFMTVKQICTILGGK